MFRVNYGLACIIRMAISKESETFFHLNPPSIDNIYIINAEINNVVVVINGKHQLDAIALLLL